MFIVQYTIQFDGPPGILATHVQHRFTQANCGSINTTVVAFYALLLPSKHC